MDLKTIYEALKGLPEYLSILHERKIKQFRHYQVPNKRILAEFDIVLLKPFHDYKAILLLIDCKTRKLWFSLLKSKKKPEVEKGLQEIISKTGFFERASSDGELRFTAEWWRKRNTFYRYLSRARHPRYLAKFHITSILVINLNILSFVESAQRGLKQRLYSYLRLNHTKDWVSAIETIIDSINSSAHSGKAVVF